MRCITTLTNYADRRLRDVLVEMVHDARIIPIFDSPESARANRLPSQWEPWFGDAVGWYEDGALVVETVNIKPQQMSQSSVPITNRAELSNASATTPTRKSCISSPWKTATSGSWTAELSFYATEDRLYEYACHEYFSMPGSLYWGALPLICKPNLACQTEKKQVFSVFAAM